MKYLAFIVGLMVIFLAGCVEENQTVVHEPSPDDIVWDKELGFEDVTRQQCVEAGGSWNECGSPCAGTNADSCIERCQVQCECGGIAGFGCPEGFKCRLSGRIADEMGVCIKK